ncbi:MAG: fumarate hydratase [Thermoproteota archaeon]
MDYHELKRHVVETIRICETILPTDVKEALRKAFEEESGELPKRIMGILLENVEIAERENRPICQDTGALTFYVKRDGWNEEALQKVIREAVIEASEKIPLRPNAIDYTSMRNSGNNTGKFAPWLVWEPGEGCLEITVIAKGGGSEAVSGLKVLPTTAGKEDIFRMVLESVAQAGARPCPPIILGVGIGPSSDIALDLAKRAVYLRPLGKRHENKVMTKMEEDLLGMVNKLDIGVHGLGGVTALDVHIEYASIHPSSMVVGVMASCWALRRAVLRVSDGVAEVVSHNLLL